MYDLNAIIQNDIEKDDQLYTAQQELLGAYGERAKELETLIEELTAGE